MCILNLFKKDKHKELIKESYYQGNKVKNMTREQLIQMVTDCDRNGQKRFKEYRDIIEKLKNGN